MRGGYGRFVMYEMNQVYRRSDGVDEDNVPNGRYELAAILLDGETKSNYYLAKKYLEDLLRFFEIEFEISEFAQEKDSSNAYYEAKRSAKIMSGDVVLGYLGEFKAGVLQGFKLPLGTAGFELDINKMLELAGKAKQNVLRFSQFPSVGRDLTLTVDEKQSYAEVEKLYGEIGRTFAALDPWQVYILTSDEQFERHYGKRADKVRKLYNGMIPCRLYQFFRSSKTLQKK
jgi:phenylalanyl-tRNA synthetase beta subunit